MLDQLTGTRDLLEKVRSWWLSFLQEANCTSQHHNSRSYYCPEPPLHPQKRNLQFSSDIADAGLVYDAVNARTSVPKMVKNGFNPVSRFQKGLLLQRKHGPVRSSTMFPKPQKKE
jgi:hypothetical protein